MTSDKATAPSQASVSFSDIRVKSAEFVGLLLPLEIISSVTHGHRLSPGRVKRGLCLRIWV